MGTKEKFGAGPSTESGSGGETNSTGYACEWWRWNGKSWRTWGWNDEPAYWWVEARNEWAEHR